MRNTGKGLGSLSFGLIIVCAAIALPRKSWAMNGCRVAHYSNDEQAVAMILVYAAPIIKAEEAIRCYNEALSLYHNRNSKDADYKRAFGCFTFVSLYTNDPMVKAGSWYYIGRMYQAGRSGVPNFERAAHYYTMAAFQNDDKEIKFWASVELAKLLLQGGHGIQKNMLLAKVYRDQAERLMKNSNH